MRKMMLCAALAFVAVSAFCGDDGRFHLGADISWITGMEANKIPICGRDGKPMDGFAVMRDFGLDAIRLRVWVNPSAHDNWCDAKDTLVKARRAQTAGMDVMIDFHYSDWWADPGKQEMPAAWRSHDRAGTIAALAKHTEDVLSLLKRDGIRVKWVQVGNETSNGMFWSPEKDANGKLVYEKKTEFAWVPRMKKDAFADLYTHPENYAACFAAGYDAVKRVYPDAVVIVHHADGCNAPSIDYNLEQLSKYGAKWDMVGISLYPYHSRYRNPNEEKTIDEAIATLHHVAERWQCDTMIVETGFECVPAKYEEGRRRLADIIRRSRLAPRCRGVFYWEPLCNPVYHHYQLGAFDGNGCPTPIMDGFLSK